MKKLLRNILSAAKSLGIAYSVFYFGTSILFTNEIAMFLGVQAIITAILAGFCLTYLYEVKK
jgi:hypothetical protein